MKNKLSVLVVEDDEAIRLSMAELLEGEGYEIRLACDGGQAIANLRQYGAPALILLDLMMPNVDGFQFRHEQRLENLHLDVPIVIMSAHANVRAACQTIGAIDLIGKPVDVETILKIVKKHCRSGAGTSC